MFVTISTIQTKHLFCQAQCNHEYFSYHEHAKYLPFFEIYWKIAFCFGWYVSISLLQHTAEHSNKPVVSWSLIIALILYRRLQWLEPQVHTLFIVVQSYRYSDTTQLAVCWLLFGAALSGFFSTSDQASFNKTCHFFIGSKSNASREKTQVRSKSSDSALGNPTTDNN